LIDGLVGRVQFLTGQTYQHQQNQSSKKTKGKEVSLSSAMKGLKLESAPPKSSQSPIIIKAKPPQKSIISGIGPQVSLSSSNVQPETPSIPLKSFRPGVSNTQLDAESLVIKEAFMKQQSTKAYSDMKRQREGLPAFSLRLGILDIIKRNQVVVVTGKIHDNLFALLVL
jgi:HrpA-like RNA helicase